MRMHKKVQSLWIGTLSPVERLSIASFLKHGFSYDLYVYGDVGPVPAGTRLRDGNEILPGCEIFHYSAAAGPGQGSVSSFSNFFRYKLLLERGGIWVDTDNVCAKSFEVAEESVFSSCRLPQGGTMVTTSFIQAPPHSPILRYCWQVCQSKNREALKWGETGPALLHAAVEKYGAQSSVQDPEFFCPIDWWNTGEQLLGTARHDCITEKTCMVHLWNEVWRRNNFSKHTPPTPGSTYERLVNQHQPKPGNVLTRRWRAFCEGRRRSAA
jgi:Alpha 1,4-glycosyltransferase conserved region/Glycosyltransferase sugar-binding region containing DXD motif